MSEYKKKKNPAATMMMTSLAYIVLGIVTVVFPQKVLDVLCYALGGAMTVYGLFNIISFFVDREGGMYFELVIGVISTGFGIFALFSPTSIAAIINIPIGIIIIVDSIMDMKHSLTLRSLGMRKWWIPFIIAIVMIMFSLTTIFFTNIFGALLMIALGIALIYEGVSGFSLIILLSRYHKEYDRNQRMIDAEATDIN
mgnify:FL=1